MESRDNNVIELRGNILETNNEYSSIEEKFQNSILRPILKLQNDLFIKVFTNYVVKQKNVFYGLTPDKKMAYIENVIQRNILKGIVLAFFTLDEFKEYIQNSSSLIKRMMNMITERLKIKFN